jgi:pSer/pThr/pTyr-binding forkhead associated (FHA) protein
MPVNPSGAAPKESSPSTVALQPGDTLVRQSAARLSQDAAPETNSLIIPQDRTIKICVVAGLSHGMEFELSRPLITIGRLGGDADIQIDDPEVSRLHCSVEVRRDAILLHDLRSMNGTFIADGRILSARLKKLSQFRIGSTRLQLDILPRENPRPDQ